MPDDRPQTDLILVAKLTGEARFRAKWRDLAPAEESAAVAELQSPAAGRPDLLAAVAGLLEGAAAGDLEEALMRQAAGLCRKAGADPEAIGGWAEEGRCQSAAARKPPFSGGLYQSPGPGAGLPAGLGSALGTGGRAVERCDVLDRYSPVTGTMNSFMIFLPFGARQSCGPPRISTKPSSPPGQRRRDRW